MKAARPLAVLTLCLSLAACKASAPAASGEQPPAAEITTGLSTPTGPTGGATGSTGSTGAATGATGSTGAAKAPASNGLESGPASEEIVAAARKIQTQLECLRGKAFKEDPKVAFQSLPDFRAYVKKQVDKELGGPKGEQLVRMLHALDVVDPSIDVIDMLIEAAVGQAAAYYDPDTNTFYVVQEMPALMLDSVMAHELQHALQDQHTELLDEYLDQGFGSTDKDLATRFIVEGEATLIGHSWLVDSTQRKLLGANAPEVCHLPGREGGDARAFWPVMRKVVAEAAAQTREDVLNPGLLTKLASSSMMSEGMAESMEQLRAMPVYFFYTLLLPYNQGGMTVYESFEGAGYDWARIDALFAKPPETTEQVLHPEKLKSGEGFASVAVATRPPLPEAAAAAWTSDPPDRLGELLVRILLIEEGLDERTAISAASGWNGDQIRVWHDASGQLAFDWTIAWDDAKSRQEFVSHLPALLRAQRGESLGELTAFDPAAPKATHAFTWTDSQGRTRHGRVDWSARELHWTDGWPSAPQPAPAG